MEAIDLRDLFSVSLILFAIIDIPGNLPIVMSMKEQGRQIQAGKATIAAGLLMIVFLFAGKSILHLFGVDVGSFAVAGSIVIFIIGLEMILGITIMKEPQGASSTSIVPVAFPLIAGAGTLTTILALKAEFNSLTIIASILINLIFVYIVLRSSDWIILRIGKSGADVLKRIFGIILLAIAIKLFQNNWSM
jgi:multiple antibiotic resistance protein